MIGVALILALGGYWVLVLVCAKRDQGVVVRETTYADAAKRLAEAIVQMQIELWRALEPVMRAATRALEEWRSQTQAQLAAIQAAVDRVERERG